MDSTGNITVLSLCTGYGGLDIGLSRAIQRPMRVVAVEIEAYALANLVQKTEQGKMAIEALWPDLKTFPAAEFSGCFDIITAGIPCQPWSVAGKQEGIKDERWLWDDIYQIIVEVQPTLCFFEEVPGFVRGGGLGHVLSDLAKEGYDAEWDCFTASQIGAPHKRERLFILGHSRHQPTGSKGDGFSAGTERQTQEVRASQGNRSTNSSELENSSGFGRRGRDNGEPTGQGRPLQTPGPGELAVPISEQGRLHTKGRDLDTETRSASKTMADNNGPRLKEQRRPEPIQQEQRPTECSGTRWPARPGQPQYEWEEPRTVKPSVGRAVDGPSSRVDRLRLLGNGVVPAQAELAFRTLIAKISME